MILWIVFIVYASVGGLLGDESDRFFESKVRPIFVEHCIECHGESKQKGGLRLDSREGLSKGGSLGSSVTPGEPDASLIIRAVRRSDEELVMPPKTSLSIAQIEVLERWIRDGAVWPGAVIVKTVQSLEERRQNHWAYQPINLPANPDVRSLDWVRSSLDRFVLAALEGHDLSPSPQAGKATLIRRAYISMIGLPPTFDAVQQFSEDERPDAFERVVDELLNRPEYGERWGRHWLDVARYADAKGYVDAGEVKNPFAYTYRDYVVRSFNEDRPYDQFVKEQLAADRLPERDPESLAALGFLTVGSRYNFFPHEIIDDRIDVVTRGLLGLSVACARCHDHKYDPIPAADYYSLYGIFAASVEPTLERVPVLSSVKPSEDLEFAKKLAKTAEKYHQHRRELHEKVMLEMRGWAGDYLRYVVQTAPEHRTESQPEMQTKRGLIREVSAYATGGVWRWRNYLKSRPRKDPVFGLWTRLGALSRDQFAAKSNGILETFRMEPYANSLLIAEFAGKPLESMADVADRYASLLERIDSKWREALNEHPELERFSDAAKEEVRMALYQEGAPGTLTLEEAFDYCTLDESVELRKHFAEVERVFLENWDKTSPRPMMLEDMPECHPQHVFLRGDSKRLGDVVPRAIPESLGLDQAIGIESGSGRLELAKAIASSRNPLTARVIVNRLWAWHFGQGLVSTPSDFGFRSELPSHPELLDYLAHGLMQRRWSLKGLHRQILLSATWQQSSVDRPKLRAKDPMNRFLWRQNRHRMEFEVMRDSMLFVAGHLEPRLGGPPVRLSPDSPTHKSRTLYTFIDREKLEDLFRVFDFPSPDITASERPRTTVPQQSLFLLNSPFVSSQASALVKAGIEALGADSVLSVKLELVKWLFERMYQRGPSAEEMGAVVQFLDSRGEFPEQLDEEGKHPMVVLAQTLFLSNEFLFVD
ncbi:PSD1 and planctomycete cytochrome C domain-containing protein [Verrucomicrobia bacterium]|jgi:hypothetical protein|nr:PSD1 and planctomycete cytochrome C domain-containing protein [Verrucomicrobiota bacterium]